MIKVIKHVKYFFLLFFLYIKISNNYYQKHKERLQKETHGKYQNLCEEEKNKSWKKTRERQEEGEEKENKTSISLRT